MSTTTIEGLPIVAGVDFDEPLLCETPGCGRPAEWRRFFLPCSCYRRHVCTKCRVKSELWVSTMRTRCKFCKVHVVALRFDRL